MSFKQIDRITKNQLVINKNSLLNFFSTIQFRKDICVFDFDHHEYWCFEELANNCACLTFDPRNHFGFLIGTRYGSVLTVRLSEIKNALFHDTYLHKKLPLLLYFVCNIADGMVRHRIKLFDSIVVGIVPIEHITGYFICYSTTEALICKCNKNDELEIVRRFINATTIKSILAKLFIRKIVVQASNDRSLTVAVLLNDESLYIFEMDAVTEDYDTSTNPIKMTKHIHPIEMRDLHHARKTTEDQNNSKFVSVICSAFVKLSSLDRITIKRSFVKISIGLFTYRIKIANIHCL